MLAIVRRVISLIVDEHYPSKAYHERMSLHDLIAFGVMAHIVFDGIYKKAYGLFVEELGFFSRVRYNKVGG